MRPWSRMTAAASCFITATITVPTASGWPWKNETSGDHAAHLFAVAGLFRPDAVGRPVHLARLRAVRPPFLAAKEPDQDREWALVAVGTGAFQRKTRSVDFRSRD